MKNLTTPRQMSDACFVGGNLSVTPQGDKVAGVVVAVVVGIVIGALLAHWLAR